MIVLSFNNFSIQLLILRKKWRVSQDLIAHFGDEGKLHMVEESAKSSQIREIRVVYFIRIPERKRFR